MYDHPYKLVFFMVVVLGGGVVTHADALLPGEDQPPKASAAKAAGSHLSWEEAIRIGLQQHPSIQIAQHQANASETVTKQLESAHYPQITGVITGTGGNTRVLANLNVSGSLPKPTLYMVTPGLRVDLLITDFGHTTHKILANESLTKSAEQRILTSQALTILDIQQAYLNVLKHQELVQIAQNVLQAREQIRQQVESLYRNQLRSKLDLDFATVSAKQADVGFVKAKKDLQLAFTNLNLAMGQAGSQEYTLDPVSITVQPGPPITQLVDVALEQRPEVRGSRFHIAATEEGVKAAKALRYGQIEALGILAYSYWSRTEVAPSGSVKNPGKQLGWYGAALASSFPLFTGGRIEGQVDEAQGRLGEAVAGARAIANDVILQVMQAYLTHLMTAHEISLAQKQVEQAQEARDLSTVRYETGLGSIIEVVMGTTNFLVAKSGLIEAQYNYRISEAALAFATGDEYRRYVGQSQEGMHQ